MRVLVNATSVAPGGGATFAAFVLRELGEIGGADEYVVLVKDDYLEEFGPWPPNIAFREVGRRAASGGFRVLWEQAALRRLLRSEDCEILFGIGGFGLPWSRHPQVIVAQNALFYEIPPGTGLRSRLRRRAQRWLQVASVRSGASVVCVSDYMRDLVGDHVGDAKRSITVIPHGTDMGVPTVAPGPRVSTGDPAILLWVGVSSPHKNLNALLVALPIVERLTGNSVVLHIAGAFTGSEEGAAVHRVQALGASREPLFLGHLAREELRTQYLGATVFVSTSLLESSDMSVLEAMAMGTPVVGSDIPVRGAAKEAMRTYAPGDANELASVLADVLLDEIEQSRLASLGFAYAHDLSWRTAAIRYRAVFADAIEYNRRR